MPKFSYNDIVQHNDREEDIKRFLKGIAMRIMEIRGNPFNQYAEQLITSYANYCTFIAFTFSYYAYGDSERRERTIRIPTYCLYDEDWEEKIAEREKTKKENWGMA